jgi:hypothetical protein
MNVSLTAVRMKINGEVLKSDGTRSKEENIKNLLAAYASLHGLNADELTVERLKELGAEIDFYAEY